MFSESEREILAREGERFAETLARASGGGSARELDRWISRAQADISEAEARADDPAASPKRRASARLELAYKPSLLRRLREIRAARARREAREASERGVTLPELLATIAIMGILLAIGIIIFLGLLERWRVDAATNQLKADLRLAHTNATNQLTDWRVVLVPEREGEDEGPDYHLVRLAAPYPASGTPPVVAEDRPRTFPANVKILNIRGTLDTGAPGGWAVLPSRVGRTRTVEFNTDGAARFYGGVSGSTCVTVDRDPENRVIVLAATSRVRARPDDC